MKTLQSLTPVFYIKKVTVVELTLPGSPPFSQKPKIIIKVKLCVYQQVTFPREVKVVYSSLKSDFLQVFLKMMSSLINFEPIFHKNQDDESYPETKDD